MVLRGASGTERSEEERKLCEETRFARLEYSRTVMAFSRFDKLQLDHRINWKFRYLPAIMIELNWNVEWYMNLKKRKEKIFGAEKQHKKIGHDSIRFFVTNLNRNSLTNLRIKNIISREKSSEILYHYSSLTWSSSAALRNDASSCRQTPVSHPGTAPL